MKPEYQNKVMDNLDAILLRNKVLLDMIEGRKPANPADAVKFINEVEQFVDRIRNVVMSRNSYLS